LRIRGVAVAISRKVVLHFPRRLVERPIVCQLALEYKLTFNILKASVTPREEGLLVLELCGEKADYERGVKYLKDSGVQIQPLSQSVIRDEDRCTHCGACVTVCPAGAFTVEPKSRTVTFADEKCIACELCIPVCPLRAMTVKLQE
jgi:L-aspartate semialdehyde sulfurtransferase ferredoxin